MDKLSTLRQIMVSYGLEGLLIPQADEFQNDYLFPGLGRLEWLTEFTGSAGIGLVTQTQALFFTDARYLLQAEGELPQHYEIYNLHQMSPARWITKNLGEKAKIGYEPWLFTEGMLSRYSHLSLLPLAENLIDKIWTDKPDPPLFPVKLHPLCYAGESTTNKRERLGRGLNTDYFLLTACDSIAWLLNIRGQDAPYSPLVHSVCLLKADGSFKFFVDLRKITEEVRAYLESHHGELIDLSQIFPSLETLEGTCGIDPDTTPVIFIQALEAAGVTIIRTKDPCVLPKALKNEVEVQGAIEAHIQDGAALCQFFTWLFRQPLEGETTEISAATQLLEFRQERKHFKGPSFPTISSMGPHGALVHYHPTPSTASSLTRDGLYLVDSGGQYLNGTTDVTRTFALGTPSSEAKDHYTRVLKGHIALSSAVFPKGTTGIQLDVLARQFLWEAGLDYAHGTGHGVGSYLRVHEGPQRISTALAHTPLEPGMILSNEPGYYKEGAYGIRIENLIYVVKSKRLEGFYAFEPLTLVPFDLHLIDFEALSFSERAWVKTYHTLICETLSPYVNLETREWLELTAKASPE